MHSQIFRQITKGSTCMILYINFSGILTYVKEFMCKIVQDKIKSTSRYIRQMGVSLGTKLSDGLCTVLP